MGHKMSNPSDKLPHGISGDDWFAKLKNAGHREFAKEFEMRELGRILIENGYTTPAALLSAIENAKAFANIEQILSGNNRSLCLFSDGTTTLEDNGAISEPVRFKNLGLSIAAVLGLQQTLAVASIKDTK